MNHWRDKDGRQVEPGDQVETIGGKRRKIETIDEDGYARLDGEISTYYVPHLTKIM